jgi:hypothetical protein
MYEFLAALFSVITCLCAYGMIRYGFNIIFLYILIFSAVLVAWLVVAIIEERKRKGDAG